jgi:hypothetical protein
MAEVRQGSRDSDLTATDVNCMNDMNTRNGRQVLKNPLVTAEKGSSKRKDEEAQLLVNEKDSVSSGSIKV